MGRTSTKTESSADVMADEIRHRLHGIDGLAEWCKLSVIPLDLEPYRRLEADGVFFAGSKASTDDPIIHAHVRRYRPKPKECFYNCQQFVLDDRTSHAAYHEGFVTSLPGIFVHHAWLVVGGTVFDPTLEAADRVLTRRQRNSERPSARQYFGVPFPIREVAEGVLSGVWGPLLAFPFATI